MIGSTLKGTYRILDKIGGGTFAVVYLARNIHTNEVVAVKVLRDQFSDDPTFVRRYDAEARLVEQLHHPNIVRVIDHGVEGQAHYLVMEFVEGKTVADMIHETGPLPIELAVSIASQVCHALEAARVAHVVHRDIKPHNMMVTPKGVVKVMDFGIARGPDTGALTATNVVVGTPRYMAPELVKGEKADVRSDLYALGVVLYEMLAGNTPFVADSPWAMMRQQIEAEPTPIRSYRKDVPESLIAVIDRILAKDPARRFQTPSELLAALGQQPAALPVMPVARRRQRVVWPWLAGSAAALVAIGILLVAFVFSGITPDGTAVVASDVPVSLAASNTPVFSPTVSVPVSPTVPIVLVTATTQAAPSPVTLTPIPTEPADDSEKNNPTEWISGIIKLVQASVPTPTPPPPPTSTRTPVIRTPVPTTPPVATTPAPAPTRQVGGLSGRIAFAVQEGGSHKWTLHSVAANNGSDIWFLGDYLHQPCYRQDGLEIVANGEGGGKNDLWRVYPDRRGPIAAIGHLDDNHPVYVQARRGYQIAFDSTRQGDNSYRLYLGEGAISSGASAIYGRHPVALPGEFIAYDGCDYGFGTNGSQCGVWRVSAWGGLPTRILDDSVIPTGGGSSGVLYMKEANGNYDVWLVGTTGGRSVQLTTDPHQDGLATFSPDGSSIAFLSNRSGVWAIWLMGANGSNQRKLADVPGGGNYGSWTEERLSWGREPAPAPTPVRTGSGLLVAPVIAFPIPDDEVSSRKPTTIRWTWSNTLKVNQGFEVRFWHVSEGAHETVAGPTTELELTFNVQFTPTYKRHGDEFYYLEVVVVQLDTGRELSQRARIRVHATVNK